MDIFLRGDSRKSVISVESNCTVNDLKLKIQQTQQIPVEQQILTLWLLGKHLDRDDRYLSDYNIHHGSSVELVDIRRRRALRVRTTNPYQITIKMRNETESTYQLSVQPNDRIKTVKQQVFEKIGIPINHQILRLNEMQLHCDDNCTLSNALIQNNAVIFVKSRYKQINISIKFMNYKTYELSINQSNTVNDLKILMEEKYGIPAENQVYQEISESLVHLDDGMTVQLTLPVCETYKNWISRNYINQTNQLSKKLNDLLASIIAANDTLLLERKKHIKTSSSLKELRIIRHNILSAAQIFTQAFLKTFKEKLNELKADLLLQFHTKHVLKCQEKNHYVKAKIQKLKIEMATSTSVNECIKIKRRIQSLQKFCYTELCNFIKDTNVKKLDETVERMEHSYVHLYNQQEATHEEEFKRAINDKMKEFESNFTLWDVQRTIQWIVLIENGYFDDKQHQTFIKKMEEIGIDGTKIKDVNNKLLLNMIGLKQKQHQYILRKHINRIIQQHEYNNDQSMCGLCIENPINTVIIPCGHQYLCSDCSPDYHSNSCPICRNEINQIVRTFLSGFSK